MSDNNSTQDADRTILRLNNATNSEVHYYFILAAVIFLSYGYEIFNFNLTIDEEIHAGHGGQWLTWIAQGRWGMGAINNLLVPNPVVPVTSLFVGLLGLVLGKPRLSPRDEAIVR